MFLVVSENFGNCDTLGQPNKVKFLCIVMLSFSTMLESVISNDCNSKLSGNS
jgi:hypothetical protein